MSEKRWGWLALLAGFALQAACYFFSLPFEFIAGCLVAFGMIKKS